MRTNQLSALAFALGMLAAPPANAQTTQPSIPVGSLTAFPTVVQTGTKPTLTWTINYPSVVKNFLTITNGTGVPSALGATVTPNQNLICDIRILGAGVTTHNSNGSIVYIETAGKMRYNGSSSWTSIFDGKQTDTIVQTQGIIKTINVTAGQTMDFGGQYYYNGSWFTFFNSTNGTNVQTLVNGDACPTYIPAYNAPSLETFLKPYLDSSNKVRIGPMDVVIFMELTHTDKTNPGYDFQDLVLLVTFRTS